jgi:cytochrome P450
MTSESSLLSRNSSCPHLEGFDPLQPEQIGEPYAWLARARQQAPVFYMPKYQLWCITRYDDVMFAYKNTALFSNRNAHAPQTPMPTSLREEVGSTWEYPLRGNLNVEDAPDHMRMKRMILQAFNQTISEMEPWVSDHVNRLIDGISDKSEFDFVQAFSWPLTIASITHVLGVPENRSVRFREWAEAWFELSGSTEISNERAAQCWRSLVDLEQFVRSLIAEHRLSPGSDITSRVVQMQAAGGKISDQEIVSNLFGLVAAGADTTAQLLGQLLYLLLTHPQQLNEIKADRSLVDNAIEEALRLRSPVRGLIRTTTQEVSVGGVMLPAAAKVYLHVTSASRDESIFENPDRFDIHRSNAKKHVAFGALTRLCIGAPLARVETRAALNGLFDRLPTLRLSERQGPLQYSSSMIVPSIKYLYLCH